MSEVEKFICGDCKTVTKIPTGKRGSGIVEFILWQFILPGIFYSMWRRKKYPRICSFCGGNFLLPADEPQTHEFIKSMDQTSKH